MEQEIDLAPLDGEPIAGPAAEAMGATTGTPSEEADLARLHDVPVELRRSVVDTRERFYEADRGKVEGRAAPSP